MTADPTGDLFRRQGGAVGWRLTVLIGLVGLNAWITSPGAAALLLLGALGLLMAEARRLRVWWMLGAVAASAALSCSAGWWLGLDPNLLWRVGMRWTTGAACCLWFGSTVSWPSLVGWLRARGAPSGLLEVAELGMAHGLLLLRTFVRKREAALVRGGRGLAVHGEIFGAGMVSAMARATALEESHLVRSAGGRPGASMVATGPVLAMRDLDVGAQERRRLQQVSVSVASPEWIVLAGPSGAGKTTFLRVLAGLELPAAGVLSRFGSAVAGRTAASRVDRRVAMVFQDPEDQLFAATAIDDLLWGLRWQNVPEAEGRERAQHTLETLGLGHLANRPVHEMSFGERKRLALATALVGDAELILCDEPTMGLDASSARRLVRAVEDALGTRAVTVVWSTHDLEHLPRAVSRMWLLREGRLIHDGPPQSQVD